MCFLSNVVSPTGVSHMAKLAEENRMSKIKIKYLEDKIQYLEELNKELKKDKAFLHAALANNAGNIHYHSVIFCQSPTTPPVVNMNTTLDQ